MDFDLSYLEKKQDKDDKIPTYVVKVTNKYCPNCGSSHIHTHQSGGKRNFLDVDEDRHFRIIECNFFRHKCNDCGHIWQAFDPEYLNRYTTDCQDYIVDSFYNGSKTTADLGKESGQSPQTIRGILRSFKDSWESKKRYELPGDLAVTPVFRREITYYVISDVVRMTVLDVLTESELLGLNTHRVRNLYLGDTRIPEKALRFFQALHLNLYLLPDAVYESGIRALLEDARTAGQDIEELEPILRGTAEERKEYLRKNVSAANFVLGANTLEKALRYDSGDFSPKTGYNMENFSVYLSSLPLIRDINEAEDDRLLTNFFRRLREFVLLAESLSGKFRSFDQFRTKLLYFGEVDEGIISPSGDVLFNFGKHLEPAKLQA